MNGSTCVVSAEDYRQHWRGGRVVQVPVWNGLERRLLQADRRVGSHERRWEQSRGRRFRLSDRRVR